MEECFIRGWDLIHPGLSEPSTFARRETSVARWVQEPQSFSERSMGVGVPHRAGWC